MDLRDQFTLTLEEFTSEIVPALKQEQIAYKLVTKPKAYNKTHNLVSLYENEYQPNYTFVSVLGKIYRFVHPMPTFTSTNSHSPHWQGPLVTGNFEAITLDSLPTMKPQLVESNVTIPISNTHVEAPAMEKVSAIPIEPESVLTSVPTIPLVKPLDEHGTGTSEGFTRFIEQRLDGIRETVVKKGREYHRGGNPFHNFDSTGKMNRQLPERALWGMVSKQIVGVLDLVEDIEAGKMPSEELIFEKTNDVRVYMFLMEALMLRTLDQQAA